MTALDSVFVFGAKYLFVLAIVIALVWFLRLPKGKKKEAFVFGLIALPAIYVAAKVGSWLYVDPRPFVVGHFIPLVPHAADNGFPSDHTLLVSAIASIIFPFDRKTSAAVWVIAILVGLSRVYVGIHHPIDIVGSIVISIAASAVAYQVFPKFAATR
jgi:undecaprenyl-diphosphatase